MLRRFTLAKTNSSSCITKNQQWPFPRHPTGAAQTIGWLLSLSESAGRYATRLRSGEPCRSRGADDKPSPASWKWTQSSPCSICRAAIWACLGWRHRVACGAICQRQHTTPAKNAHRRRAPRPAHQNTPPRRYLFWTRRRRCCGPIAM